MENDTCDKTIEDCKVRFNDVPTISPWIVNGDVTYIDGGKIPEGTVIRLYSTRTYRSPENINSGYLEGCPYSGVAHHGNSND